MQRTKKPMIWLMMVALVVSLIPAGLAPVASAAGQTSYFTPDNAGNVQLKDTVGLKMSGTGTDVLSRSTAFVVTNNEQAVTGTFTNVTGSTLGANVQLMNLKDGTWVPDSTRVAPAVVTVDPDRPDNRFKATLTLFPGMNKVTFTGSQGPSERSESFYILYDSVPYIEKLQVLGGADNLDLNEGSQVVVDTGDVTIQGVAHNSSKVTVSLNNGEALPTSLSQQDGTFFSPMLRLKAGKNDVVITIESGVDKNKYTYSLLYYDEENPFSQLDLNEGSGGLSQSMLSERPTYGGDPSQASVTVQLLLPDDKTTAVPEISVDGALSGIVPKIEPIPSVGINTPSYALISFEIPTLKFTESGTAPDTTIDRLQNHSLTVKYGKNTASVNMNFQYLENETVITDLRYLKDYSGTGVAPAGVPLSGSSVTSADFYILVETSRNPNGSELTAEYLPRGTSAIELSPPIQVSPTKYIYQIKGFKNGNQTVQFKFAGSTSSRNATISFASKNYIFVSNLTDGQTYDMNSKKTDKLLVEGKYVDFATLDSNYFVAEIFANGVKVYSTHPAANTTQKKLTLGDDGSFKDVEIDIDGDNGPLFFGENRIVLTGTGTGDKGQLNEVTKELRIYINDNNVSTINNFQPAPSKNRSTFLDPYNPDDQWVKNLFNLSTDFTFADKKYTTSLKNFDLAIRGAGAIRMSLSMGTQTIFDVNIPEGSAGNTTWEDPTISPEYALNNGNVIVDRAGNQKDFVVRLRDLKAETPGTYIYTLDLYNKTGAKTSQKVEVVREAAGYRIIAPQPTSGSQIVVNKNFVHFDIEAEGATSVIIDKETAKKLQGTETDRFALDYVGLKSDKVNKIKLTIDRNGVKTTNTIEVYYTSATGVDSQYMAPKVATKYSAFNKQLELSFPKGTVMESLDTSGIAKFYPNNKLLFGIADPNTGIVERRNDYGSIVGFKTEEGDPNPLSVPDDYYRRFSAITGDSVNFSPISDIYWISGGLGESGTRGTDNYKEPTNGLGPYTIDSLYGNPLTPAERKIKPSQRGTLTLTYDSNVVDDAGSTISVFYYSSSREWKRIGGEVDSKKHTVTVPFDNFGYYKVMKLRRSYNDITNHGWARNILNALYAKGFMAPLRFEQFGTDDRTSRGEFATLLVKGLNLPITSDSRRTFTDVAPGTSSYTWDYDSIETAARAGIITGLTDGVFGPDRPLTREQAAVMIARALELKLAANDNKLQSALAKSFIDSGSMENYAGPAVQAVTKAKIMEGSPVTVAGQSKPQYAFNPKGNLTRAEAGKIAVELLKKSTKVFPKNLS
ncbi:S-layer homology domain-containing protein [Paenibacillus sp. FSL K6-0108]|uniref:S-layer homology domain-containing protein n=1 Tax=Paenibacillus sp. FSL K6-0108 TaxID=2921417 RepID=UPI0032462F04